MEQGKAPITVFYNVPYYDQTFKVVDNHRGCITISLQAVPAAPGYYQYTHASGLWAYIITKPEPGVCPVTAEQWLQCNEIVETARKLFK